MEGLKPPQPLNFDGNLAENWKRFKQKYDIYAKASELTKKEAIVQVNVFLHVIGEEALEKYNTFDISEEDGADVNNIIKKFEDFCLPKSNESVDRHIFFTRNQEEGEKFDDFLTTLKKLSNSCGFGDLKDSLIRDRIISGIRDKILKDRLLRETDITLEKCVKIAKASELAEIQLRALHEDRKIDAVKKNVNEKTFKKNNLQIYDRNKQGSGLRERYSHQCGRCGKSHLKFNCPAFNAICKKCHKKNHFAKMCKSRVQIHMVNANKNFNAVSQIETKTLILGSVKEQSYSTQRDWFEKLKVNVSKYLYVKLDTGAQCNVIPWEKFQQLRLREDILKESNTHLSNYNGSQIDVVGKCKLLCETSKGIKALTEFQVVKSETKVSAVLGLPSLMQLDLVKRVESIHCNKLKFPEPLDKYRDLFNGMGKIKGYTYDIKLKPDAAGRIEPCRKVPIHLMNALKNELCKMENSGIIRKVNEPTEFVSSLVIVRKKDGALRLCLDPQYLNSVILREHFHLPTFEEIVSRMPGAKYFSILDAHKAFWQVELSEECSKFTTFNTPFGRFCFLRLPYGISSAPEVFQKCFTETFKDIEGVEIYIDDILVWGSTQEEHDLRLNRVLERARKSNVKFNLEKCKINVNQVKYLGHIFSGNGIEPDNDKIEAISKMKIFVDKKGLAVFLGMITYVSKFIPNVSELTTPLRELLKKCNSWNWNKNHEKSFEELKNILVNKPVLQFFDVRKPVTLSVDASKNGLGAVILQNNLPVAYASKALNDTQINYAQIEKETLAIVFGCEKFHQYIFGKEFIIESDHKPLETIFKKPLSKCPVRLQRMRIRLQPYVFNLVYKPGKYLLLADALSRSFNENSEDFFDGEIEAHVATIVESLPMTKEKLKIFQNETEKDTELQAVLQYIINGWPVKNSQVIDLVKPYASFKEELTHANGLIFKNSCVVVPKSLRKDMISRIHFSHLGLEKSKNKAREIIYWPGMAKDIEDTIRNCHICLKFQKANSKEPLIPHEVPHGPWEVLGTDLFHLHGRDYLMVIDYFSKYVEFAHLPEISSSFIIQQLKGFFARLGIPKILYSDNGPQYSSSLFKEFSRSWNFNHKTSSPYFSQSNGMVERHIQTIKMLLKKAEYEGRDPFLVLLDYRNTPISATIPSPIELLIGRKTNGIMPVKEDFFPNKHYEEIRRHLIEKQLKEKEYHDRGAKELRNLNDGENIMIKLKEKGPLENAKVISKADRPRSYKIMTQDGKVYERNRKDLRRGSPKFSFKVSRNSNNYFADSSDKTLVYPAISSPNKQSPVARTSPRSPVPVKISRTGRVLKPPAYLKDYLTT